MSVHKNDPPFADILAQIERLSAGDYSRSPDVTAAADEFRPIVAALNQLGDTLQRREGAFQQQEKRIQGLLDTLLKYTVLDFSGKAPTAGSGDQIDAMAAGLNRLREEIIAQINKLKDSEEQIQTIFENAPDAVVVINSNNIITQWNPAATKIFGWRKEDVTGKLLHEILVPERYRARHLAGLQHFLKTGEGPVLNRTIELPALRRNDPEVEIELTISPARLKDEYLFIAFLRDITERKRAAAEIGKLNATLEQRVLERTEQLNASEAKYRQLFQNNPMPLWVLDITTWKFLDVNEAAVAHYGYSREEFLSMTSLELRPEEERQRYLDLKVKTTGTKNTGIWKHRKKDGSIIHSEVIVHHIEFEGKPARLVLSNDVTEKINVLRKLQVSEARFRRVFDSKMTGFLFWDASGTITEANDFFLEMVGYTRSDLEEGRMHLDKMTPPEYARAQQHALDQIKANGVCEPFEKEYFRKDGSRLPVMIGAADISDSESVTGVSCVMDISERKQMEQEILQLNRDLEDRINERTRTLQEVNNELESFTYSVSHDLRAPLRAIHGYSQMLHEDYLPKFDQEGIRLLNAIKFNATRMGKLVDELLSFSRMGKRPLAQTETDMTALVKEVIKDLSDERAENRINFVVGDLSVARVDRALLRQVFENLVGNAIKYSSKKEQSEIEIGVTDVNGERTWFVKDNGAGFDMAYYKKLFGVFQRLHEQQEFEGTGVGLAIVQRVIHRHGGKIWAESKVGEGAVFYFTLGSPEKPLP